MAIIILISVALVLVLSVIRWCTTILVSEIKALRNRVNNLRIVTTTLVPETITTTTTLRHLIEEEMEVQCESFDQAIACTISEDILDETQVKRNRNGAFPVYTPFTLWTNNRVYFPCAVDGALSVNSAPRNPCGESTGIF